MIGRFDRFSKAKFLAEVRRFLRRGFAEVRNRDSLG